MSKIKILIKAFGLVGDDYEGKEIKQEKIVNKNPSENHLTEIDLKRILETIITSVKDIKSLYPDEQTNVVGRAGNRLESIKFKVTYIDSTGSYQILEEKHFFEQVAMHNSLTPLILDYCKVTDNGEEGTRIWIMDEYDEGPPAGTYAILALVHQDKKWVPNYIEFLRTNDLDHEVEQMWDIKTIIEKYGWGMETCSLAIARNISCCGQGGKQQFEDFLNNGLADYLNSDENRKVFLDLILQEFREWDEVELRLSEGSKKYYIKNIVEYVKHFDKILKEEEIDKVKTDLFSKWENYHNN